MYSTTKNKQCKLVILFMLSAKWVIVLLYHGVNKLDFNDIWWYSMCTSPTLNWIFTVITHWYNRSWVNMSLHSNTLSWIPTNQFLLLILNAAYFAVFSLTCVRFDPTIYYTQVEHPTHYTKCTTDAVSCTLKSIRVIYLAPVRSDVLVVYYIISLFFLAGQR